MYTLSLASRLNNPDREATPSETINLESLLVSMTLFFLVQLLFVPNIQVVYGDPL